MKVCYNVFVKCGTHFNIFKRGAKIMNEKTIYYNGQETDYTVRDDGTIWNKKRNKEIKGTRARNEYLTVQLTLDGELKSVMTHRLVAEYFCDNPYGFNIVSHINGISDDNRAINLMWVEHKAPERKQALKKHSMKEEDLKKDWHLIAGIDGNTDYYITEDGEVANLTKKIMRSLVNRNGYKRVQLNDKLYSVHCLVWQTFRGVIPNGMVIDHIDGNRGNNALSNLRLVSQSENMRHTMEQGHKCQRKTICVNADVCVEKEYASIQKMADDFQVSRQTILRYLNKDVLYRNYYLKYKE